MSFKKGKIRPVKRIVSKKEREKEKERGKKRLIIKSSPLTTHKNMKKALKLSVVPLR